MGYEISITAKKAIINLLIAMLSGGVAYLAALPPEHQMNGAMLLMVIFKMLQNVFEHYDD